MLYKKYLHANNITITDNDNITFEVEDIQKFNEFSQKEPLKNIQEQIGKDIEGSEEIKEAIALQLCSASHIRRTDGTNIRFNSHILLIGDPATGKSHILNSASNLAPKGIYLSAEACTARGLSVVLVPVKSELGEMMEMRAGAIVLASGGGLFLDEIDKVKEETLQKLYVPMERGVISFARGGFRGEYPADAFILAAANPKYSQFLSDKSIPEQFNIPKALLSRFDLIYPFIDNPDKDKIARITKKDRESFNEKEDSKDKEDRNFIRKYIAYARTIKPKMSDEVGKIIDNFYNSKKEAHSKEVTITIRQHQGAIRLAYSSARARLSTSVEKCDADRAIRLMEHSLDLVAKDPITGELDIHRIDMGDREERQKKRKLQDILDSFKGRDFTTQQFLSEAIVKGLSEKEAREFITNAKREGRLFEPREGILNILE